MWLTLEPGGTLNTHLTVANNWSGWRDTDTVATIALRVGITLELRWTLSACLTVAYEGYAKTQAVCTTVVWITVVVGVIDAIELVRALQSCKTKTRGLALANAAAFQVRSTIVAQISDTGVTILARYVRVALTKGVSRFGTRHTDRGCVPRCIPGKFHTLGTFGALYIISITTTGH